MNQYNIAIVKVITHRDASGKHCPAQIFNGVNGMDWNKFKQALSSSKVTKPEVETSKPSPAPSTQYNGSIVDYLNLEGIKSNMANRKNLAVEYGIVTTEAEYTGTAAQNTALLKAMQTQEPKQKGTRDQELSNSTYTGSSIVDYLASIKVDNSMENRKILAKKHLGISNYTGTAKQNADLLKAMRDGKTPPSTPKSSQSSGQAEKGDRITVNTIYTDNQSTTVANTRSFTGYVDNFRSGVRNPIRLTKTKGGIDYIGWTRQITCNKRRIWKYTSNYSNSHKKRRPCQSK